MANLVDKINEKHIRKDIPEFRVGDTVRVDVWVKEGKKERKDVSHLGFLQGSPSSVSPGSWWGGWPPPAVAWGGCLGGLAHVA